MTNVIKLMLATGCDASGITKFFDRAKSLMGNMHDLSSAAKRMGSTFGAAGGMIGGFIANLARGGIWGIAQSGISAIIGLWRKHKEAAEESAKAAKEAFLKAEEASRKAYASMLADSEKVVAGIDRELKARQTLGDVIDRQTRATLQLQRAEALRAGDLAKAQALEQELAESSRQGAVDRAKAEEDAAKRSVAARKNELDAAQKAASDAAKREEELRAAAAAAKPREETFTVQSSAGAFNMTRTVGTQEGYEAAVKAFEEARKTAEAADDAVESAKAAYDAEVERWRVARENAKAVEAEQEAAREKEFAERLAAERKATAERNKAARDSAIKAQKAQMEADRKAAEAKAKEEERLLQKRLDDEKKARLDGLRADKRSNEERANDLRAKLQRAQDAVAAARGLFANPGQLDQAGDRRRARQEAINNERLANRAIDLQARNPNWRTARNLSNIDEATRRWLLAREQQQKAGNELKDVVGKLDKIEDLLKAAVEL